MNEIVKYENQMNTVAFRRFNVNELNLFFVICSKLREKDIKEVCFSFNELKHLSKYSKNDIKRFVKDLDNTYKKMIELNIKIITKDEWIRFVLFNKYSINHKNQTITIQINEPFKWVLNELTVNFTRFELSEFISIKSSYAKELYRRLKQFRTTGFYTVEIDEFRRILDIPNSYKMSDIDKWVLKPCMNELKPYFKGLKIEKIKGKYNKVEQLIFTFKIEKIDTSSYIKKEKLDYKYNSKKPNITMEYGKGSDDFDFDELLK